MPFVWFTTRDDEFGFIAVGDAPRGIIAIGGQPVGVIAIGGMATGVIAIACGLARGGIAISCGVAIGLVTFVCGAGAGLITGAVGLGLGTFRTVGMSIPIAPGKFPRAEPSGETVAFALIESGEISDGWVVANEIEIDTRKARVRARIGTEMHEMAADRDAMNALIQLPEADAHLHVARERSRHQEREYRQAPEWELRAQNARATHQPAPSRTFWYIRAGLAAGLSALVIWGVGLGVFW
ncbi:MAG: hypothetical protein AAGF12_37955 [Myxococcota bacterium]